MGRADKIPHSARCQCGFVRGLASRGGFPIEFDRAAGHFKILSTDGSNMAVIRFCFSCGGRLFDSRDEAAVERPKQCDLPAIAKTLSGITTLERCLKYLGPPNMTINGPIGPALFARLRNRRIYVYAFRSNLRCCRLCR